MKCARSVASDPAGVLQLDLLPDGRHRGAHPPEEVGALCVPKGREKFDKLIKIPSSQTIDLIKMCGFKFGCGQKRDSSNLSKSPRGDIGPLVARIHQRGITQPRPHLFYHPCKLTQPINVWLSFSPLEHLHVCEDRGDDEEDAHEDDVVGVDLLGGGRERSAVPPVGLPTLAHLVLIAVRPSPLLPIDRPENENCAKHFFLKS